MNGKLQFTVRDHVGLAVTQYFCKQTTFYILHFQKQVKKNAAVNTEIFRYTDICQYRARNRQTENQHPSTNVGTVNDFSV